uniref:BEN domain-containing protein n=1 Tax=Knipowitschia caucasica TaxID=637954 RepID=A0AAV2IZ88_KNICA
MFIEKCEKILKGHATQMMSKYDKKKKQKSTRQEARDKTLAKLKDTLSQKRSLQASEELFSSSDDCQTPVRKKRMRIQQFSPQPSSDDTDIGSPPPLQITGTDAQDNAVPSMAEIIGCLRELPETLRLMKECVEKVNTSLSHTSSTNVSHFLPGKTVAVSKRAFLRLNRTRMTVFAQELAVLLFSKDTLAKSTLTGKYGKGEMAKGQLDVIKVQAITDAVIEEFPGSTVSEVRAAIRRKCNNEHFSHKRP